MQENEIIVSDPGVCTMNLGKIILEKKLVTQLFLFILILLGIFSITRMHREAFPNVSLDKVVIEAPLPGATPEEIERLIAIPIEKQLRAVANIDKVRSYNLENVSVIMVFLREGVKNPKTVLDDIKDAVANVQLPQNAVKPTVKEITTQKQQVIDIALSLAEPGTSSAEDYRKIRDIAKAFEDKLYQIKEIAEVQKLGYKNRQFLVEVDPDALNAREIGLNTVLNTLGSRNIDVPSGVLKLNGNEYLLRTRGQFDEAKDMENLPLQGNEIGYSTLLKSVAKVFDTFEEDRVIEKVNGNEAIVLRIWKTEQADTIDTALKTKHLIESLKPKYPAVNILLFDDKSVDVTKQLSDLILNFITGLTLVVFALLLILGFRLSLIISVAIPLIFVIAFIVIKQLGMTINTITIFALVMVLGMMVDNSIVVAENTYRLMQEGLDRTDAIKQTFKDVLAPLIVSMLVISAAFAPLLFLSGIIGKFIYGIPVVILITLFSSLTFSLIFLPNWLDMFLPHSLKVTHKHNEPDEKTGVFAVIIKFYKITMKWGLKHRFIMLGVFNVFFVVMFVLAGKFLPFVMFPSGDEEELEIRIWMPIGTTLEKNLSTISVIEPALTDFAGKDLRYIRSRIGIHESPAVDPKPGQESHRTHIFMKLVPSSERQEKWKSASVLVNQIRHFINESKENGTLARDLIVDVSAKIKGPPIGKPVNLEIRGPEYSHIQEIADLYIQELKKIDGVSDIRLDLEEGKEEYRFHIDDDLAAKTDISARDISRAVRTAFNGEVASTISKGEDKVNILVRFPESYRQDMNSLKKVKVENKSRRLIPLEKAAHISKERSYSMINRQDLLRVVRLEASVDTKITTSLSVNTRIKKAVVLDENKFHGYTVNFGGEQEDSKKSFVDLVISLGFAVFVIFAIFVIYFNSIDTTLVLLGSIPFGIIGVLFALITHGQPLSFMSMLAIVALSGSIVANTLILITFIEELRAGGMPLDEAIISGGEIRLRPIFLTTVTTVIGLLPSAYGIPTLDRFVQPLSLAFGWGLTFATGVTLILVPILYRIKEDVMEKLRSFRKQEVV